MDDMQQFKILPKVKLLPKEIIQKLSLIILWNH